MTLPALAFGIIFSTLFGAVFHLITGGSLGRMIVFIVFSWLGFWGGHILAGSLDWTFWSLGQLHMGMATLGSFLFLGLGFWLSLINPKSQSKKS
jgi:hypothetical protein